ncbi:MAG: peptidoglycan-binding protein [Planctomycetota bacterium]
MLRLRPLHGAVAAGLIVLGTASAVYAYSNGRLPQSALAQIHHPTYTVYLEKNAAASWNAMRQFMLARGVGDIYPNGRISAYRTYDEQVQAKKDYGSNAATPGTSNHGLGLAVDLATQTMRTNLDRYGEQFGWAKKWSDASWEWWHIKYRAGVWSGGSGSTGGGSGTVATVLRRGSTGSKVEALQRALNSNGAHLTVDGDFGPATETAVRNFQKAHGLTADGIAGPNTLRALNLSTL